MSADISNSRADRLRGKRSHATSDTDLAVAILFRTHGDKSNRYPYSPSGAPAVPWTPGMPRRAVRIWRQWAADVTSRPMACGHFLPEKNATATIAGSTPSSAPRVLRSRRRGGHEPCCVCAAGLSGRCLCWHGHLLCPVLRPLSRRNSCRTSSHELASGARNVCSTWPVALGVSAWPLLRPFGRFGRSTVKPR